VTARENSLPTMVVFNILDSGARTSSKERASSTGLLTTPTKELL